MESANVQSSTAESTDEVIESITSRITEISVSYSYRLPAIREALSNYPESTIAAIRDYLAPHLTDYLERRHRADFLGILGNESDKKQPESASTIHEYLTYGTCLSLLVPESIFKVLHRLHDYERLPASDNYAYADEDTRLKIKALLTVTESLHRRYVAIADEQRHTEGVKERLAAIPLDWHNGIKITDDSLVSLTFDYPEQAKSIAGLLRTRGTTDSKLIREIIESEASSLREGTL